MAFSPEDLERMKLGKALWSAGQQEVLTVQCVFCEKALPAFAPLVSEDLRIDGYDHKKYSLCSCNESKERGSQ